MNNLAYTFESIEGDSESYSASIYDIEKEVIVGHTVLTNDGEDIKLPIIQGYEKPYLYSWDERKELHAWYVEIKEVTPC